MALPIVDTRPFFRPLANEIVALLRSLPLDAWERPTMAGTWRVRDVVAHMTDTALRRLSMQRDRYFAPERPGPTAEELLQFIDDLNATWARAAQRFSPRVLTDLYAQASGDLAGFIETLDLHAPALLAVSWAGHAESPQWLDVGREFTEVWHHGSQIRDAVGAAPFSEPRWLRAVLDISMHALPVAYDGIEAPAGASIAIRVTGAAAGRWTLQRRDRAWHVDEGDLSQPTAAATMSDEVAWRLLFNALAPSAARTRIDVKGDGALVVPLLRARAVIVGAPRE